MDEEVRWHVRWSMDTPVGQVMDEIDRRKQLSEQRKAQKGQAQA